MNCLFDHQMYHELQHAIGQYEIEHGSDNFDNIIISPYCLKESGEAYVVMRLYAYHDRDIGWMIQPFSADTNLMYSLDEAVETCLMMVSTDFHGREFELRALVP
jgi:hypothetical protein